MSVSADKDVDGWVNEFLLCQVISGSEDLQSLLRNPSSSIFESVECLLAIWKRIADGEVTEGVLQHLEKLEQLLRLENIEIPDSMKKAYCAAAVECTAKYLPTFGVDNSNYVNALARIWLGTVTDLSGKNSLLMSRELLEWGKKLADAVCDGALRKSINRANTRYNAVISLKRCVRDMWRLFGPSYFCFIGSRLQKTDEANNSVDVKTMNAASEGKDDRGRAVGKDDKSHAITKGIEILDSQLEKLRADMLEFEALVNDPLPDALRVAKALRLRMFGNDVVERQAQGNVAVDEDAENREDSVDDSLEGSSISRRLHFTSPEKIVISPLGRLGPSRKIGYRRPRTAWTDEEVSILREGVARFGRTWKAIKEAYPIELARRTEVDLKDKWRVECKR